MSLASAEKPLPDDVVPDGDDVPDVEELPLVPSEGGGGGAKAVAADVPEPLEEPNRALRLLVLLVRAERDDICCLREKLPLQL